MDLPIPWIAQSLSHQVVIFPKHYRKLMPVTLVAQYLLQYMLLMHKSTEDTCIFYHSGSKWMETANRTQSKIQRVNWDFCFWEDRGSGGLFPRSRLCLDRQGKRVGRIDATSLVTLNIGKVGCGQIVAANMTITNNLVSAIGPQPCSHFATTGSRQGPIDKVYQSCRYGGA